MTSDRWLLTGGRVVLPEGVANVSVLVEGGRFAHIASSAPVASGPQTIDLHGEHLVPGWIDSHVHGVAGIDVLDGEGSVGRVAARLPEFGCTAFCPTAVACAPPTLTRFLEEVSRERRHGMDVERVGGAVVSARVLAAHLESNFINPDYCGAQPRALLRPPSPVETNAPVAASPSDTFTADDIVAVILEHRRDVGIVTLAPELPGATDLIRRLVAEGIRVSLGHSDALADDTRRALDAGASRGTHLFNRMRPLSHREPGIVGTLLADERAVVELVCDGHHVHATVARMVIAAKGRERVVAITDGTAGSGLPEGSRTGLGGRPIQVREVARLTDGTMAGSVQTMAGAFRWLVDKAGCSLVDAARMCATTPARTSGLPDMGEIRVGGLADFVVLDHRCEPTETWVGGLCAWRRPDRRAR